MKSVKKVFFILGSVVVSLTLLSSCGDDADTTKLTSDKVNPTTPIVTLSPSINPKNTPTITTTISESAPLEDDWVVTNRVIPSEIPTYVQGSIKVITPAEDAKEAYMFSFSPAYRLAYYSLYACVDGLVDSDKSYQWFQTEVEPTKFDESNEMLVVSFIKYFKIPKSSFEKAVETEMKRDIDLGNDVTNEEYEPYNADIIYTFDNEIINEYYRRR